MRKRILSTLSVVIPILLVLIPFVSVSAAPTLRDSYTDTGGSSNNFASYGTDYKTEQSFTATGNYSITSVQLLAKKSGTPGDATASIYLASGDTPTGDALASSTVSTAGWTTSYVYRVFTFSTYYAVTNGTKYCIVLTAPDGDGSNYVAWQGHDTGYAGGQGYYMTNGVTWNDAMMDYNFQVYGATTGSEEAPFTITNVTELQAVANNLSAWYVLANDIDASATSSWNAGAGFAPLGDGTNKFTGNFNGNGYAIEELYIYRPSTNYVGLFGCLGADAMVTNFTIFDADITGSISTGIAAGGLYYANSTILLVGVYGDVTGSTSVGGLVGQNNGNITQCFSLGTVTSTTTYGGGLVGYSDNAHIEDSYSHSAVTGPGGACVGAGFLAQNQGAGGPTEGVFNCYSVGAPSGFGTIGGLTAIQTGTVTNYSFWDTQVSGQATSASGTGKTTTQMQTQSTFTDAGWDFTDTWTINTGCYPILQDINLTSLEEPTNFNGLPSADSVSLLWDAETHAGRYLVRYSTSTYPTTITSGTLVSQNSDTFTTQEDLSPGVTYYFSLWSELGGAYSGDYVTYAITTSAYTATTGEFEDIDTPPGWFQSTDYTVLSGLDPIYTGVNNFIDATGMPKTQGWIILWLTIVTLISLIIMFRSGFQAGFITMIIAMIVLGAMSQIPTWMVFFVIIVGIGVWTLTHGGAGSHG